MVPRFKLTLGNKSAGHSHEAMSTKRRRTEGYFIHTYGTEAKMIFHKHITRPGYMMVPVAILTIIAGSFSEEVFSQIARFAASDPGVRPGSASTGTMLPGLTPSEQRAFAVGLEAFQEVASVQGRIPGTEAGLGPRLISIVAAAVISSRLLEGAVPRSIPRSR